MGNSFRQPYGLPPSRSVVPALLLFPRICCASAREPYILPPQSCRRCSIGQQSTFLRGRDRAAPLPTHLLRICAGALKRHAPCAISKFASGKEPTGLFARKHLLTPQTHPKKILRLFLGTPWEAPIMRKTPSAARPLCGRAAPPSYIGLPQRFCEAKDLWEEEQRASEQSRE